MMTGDRWKLLRWIPVIGIAALALLPITDWIPGGEPPGLAGDLWGEWWSGTLIAVGLGVVLALASRRGRIPWRSGGWRAFTARMDLLAPGRTALVAAAAVGIYAVAAWLIHSGRPLLIDEIVEVWQGRILASGHLWVPSTGHPELFGVMNVVDDGAKVFGQFPVGGPAMLALGSLIHAEWLVGPVFAGLGVWWWGTILRRTGEPADVGMNALLLLAFAPFALFMSASHMNHVTSLTWTIGGMAGLALVTTSPDPRPRTALAAGLAFGLAATIRPVDAFAFGAPAGLWLFWRAVRDRRRALECAAAALGMAIPIGLMLAVNAATTGHALTFGYTELWGAGHGLGFHEVPWGMRHTPARGVELVSEYLLHLQVRFLETPFPSLLPALLVLAFGPRFRPFDRYLATSSAALLVLYWAYWHNGSFLGPRFVYFLIPIASLLTARFGAMVRDRLGADTLPNRVWVFTAGTAALIAIGINIPLRARQYSRSFLSARWPIAEAASAAGAHDALILVRESWGAQMIARLWGLDVPRTTSEFVYQRTDICRLDHAVERLERDGVRGAAAAAALTPLTADSARVVDSVLSIDQTERLRPGAPYDSTCVRRLRDERSGFTVMPPLILEQSSGNVYVHDQHARDTIAVARYPDRPIYVLAPMDTALGTPPSFHIARRDSLLRAWGLPPTWRPGAAVPGAP